jgi:hypothetical protein
MKGRHFIPCSNTSILESWHVEYWFIIIPSEAVATVLGICWRTHDIIWTGHRYMSNYKRRSYRKDKPKVWRYIMLFITTVFFFAVFAVNKCLDLNPWHLFVEGSIIIIILLLLLLLFFFFFFFFLLGVRGSVVVKVLWYNPEGRRWMNFFNLPHPSRGTRPWGFSASNRNDYQKQKNKVSGE